MSELYKPEIHASVLKLIEALAKIHDEGEGTLALSDVVAMFPISLPTADQQAIKNRGDITFNKQSVSGGSFSNAGATVQIHMDITTVIPSQIRGAYKVSDSQFILTFDPGFAIYGQKWPFKVPVERIRADRSRVEIDLKGDSYDQTIRHA